MTLVDAIGWMAAALTLLTFSMRAMLPLRVVGMAANVAFIAYGVAAQLYPVIALHALLLPCNLIRLCEVVRAGREGAHIPSRSIPGTQRLECATSHRRKISRIALRSIRATSVALRRRPQVPRPM